MNRSQLDLFCAAEGLPAATIDAALQFSGQRPDAAAWRAFALQMLRGAGIAGVGAGLLFFVAANWQDYGVLGRFVLLQTALGLCIGVALWRPAPATAGQGALLLATLSTGGLLALFGQSYQTGADVYELFFTWALLTLPFALAGLSGALWATWWTVLNVGLALLCGWLGQEHAVWRFLDGLQLDRAVLLMLPCSINLLGASLFTRLGRSRFALGAPNWLAQFLAGVAIVYGTAAVLAAMLGPANYDVPFDNAWPHVAVCLVFALMSVGLGFATWLRRRDVFPLALLAASWIVISTTWLLHKLRLDDIRMLFVLILWLVAVSTAAGMQLMHWQREWRASPPVKSNGDLA